MKLTVLIAFCILSICTNAQTLDEKRALSQILESTLIEYSNLRGRFKEMRGSDSIYFALVGLTNYRRAEIVKKNDGSQTRRLTIEIDSSSTAKCKAITESWRKKMARLLDKSFSRKDLAMDFGLDLGGVKGYSFENNDVKVLVFYTYLGNYDISRSYLTFERITNTSMRLDSAK
jgi:hypothetical protein